MNPPMHKRVRNLLVDTGLTAGYTMQMLVWMDTGKLSDRFIVVKPAGGSAIDSELSSEYYLSVDIISGKGAGEYEKADEAQRAMIEYFQKNPQTDCVGSIANIGGVPRPIITTEGRMVYQLMFICLYGE